MILTFFYWLGRLFRRTPPPPKKPMPAWFVDAHNKAVEAIAARSPFLEILGPSIWTQNAGETSRWVRVVPSCANLSVRAVPRGIDFDFRMRIEFIRRHGRRLRPFKHDPEARVIRREAAQAIRSLRRRIQVDGRCMSFARQVGEYFNRHDENNS